MSEDWGTFIPEGQTADSSGTGTFIPEGAATPAAKPTARRGLSPQAEALRMQLLATHPIGQLIAGNEGRFRATMGALPWLGGAAGLAATGGMGAIPIALATFLGGAGGRGLQNAALGDPQTPQGIAGSGAEAALTLGLPEAVVRAPGMIESAATKIVQKRMAAKGAEDAARAVARIESRASMAPEVRKASEAATLGRYEAGTRVGEAVKQASTPENAITAREVAERIGDLRAGRPGGRPATERQIRQLEQQVANQWRVQARKIQGLKVPGGGKPSGIVGPSGKPVAAAEAVALPIEDVHAINIRLSEKVLPAIRKAQRGETVTGDLLNDMNQAQRASLAERGGEPLAEANKAYGSAKNRDIRLRTKARNIPTPEEVELIKQAAERSAMAAARVPQANQPAIRFSNPMNPLTGWVPIPRVQGAQGWARVAGHPLTQGTAQTLGRGTQAADLLWQLLRNAPPDTTGSY